MMIRRSPSPCSTPALCLGVEVEGLGFRVQGLSLGFGVQGLGFRVQGLTVSQQSKRNMLKTWSICEGERGLTHAKCIPMVASLSRITAQSHAKNIHVRPGLLSGIHQELIGQPRRFGACEWASVCWRLQQLLGTTGGRVVDGVSGHGRSANRNQVVSRRGSCPVF